MKSRWEKEFGKKMESFNKGNPAEAMSVAISIKIRVAGGCFHREHSRHAYEIIDKFLGTLPEYRECEFQEHESGPEILVILALGTAALTLAKSVVDLIATIIKARSEGIKRGDHPDEPLEVIVRRYDQKDGVFEEKVLRISSGDSVSRKLLEKSLQESILKLIPDDTKAEKKIKNKKKP
jgi:hypothetical protein